MAPKHSAGTTTSSSTVTGASSRGLSWVGRSRAGRWTRPARRQAHDAAGRKRPNRLLLVRLVVVVVVHGHEPHGRRWRPRLGAGSSDRPHRTGSMLDRTCPPPFHDPCQARPVAAAARSHAAMTLRHNRFVAGRRVRRRPAGHSGVRQGCRAVREVRRHCRNRAAGGYYPNGHRLGYDPATLSRISP